MTPLEEAAAEYAKASDVYDDDPVLGNRDLMRAAEARLHVEARRTAERQTEPATSVGVLARQVLAAAEKATPLPWQCSDDVPNDVVIYAEGKSEDFFAQVGEDGFRSHNGELVEALPGSVVWSVDERNGHFIVTACNAAETLACAVLESDEESAVRDALSKRNRERIAVLEKALVRACDTGLAAIRTLTGATSASVQSMLQILAECRALLAAESKEAGR